jgi:hypothetical protein
METGWEKKPSTECNLMFVVNTIINLFDVLYVIITSHHISPFVPYVWISEWRKMTVRYVFSNICGNVVWGKSSSLHS